jgi:hypothetical protein
VVTIFPEVQLAASSIRFSTFPRTQAPPSFVADLVAVFAKHENAIATISRAKGLKSDQVVATVSRDLAKLGFEVETGKRASEKIERPVYFGEGGRPIVRYEIDAYHPGWKLGLEVEAGRAWMGNAVYRDIVQALVMVDVEWLALAVPNTYRFKASGRDAVSKDYERTLALVEALYGHSRMQLPYGLVLIGY